MILWIKEYSELEWGVCCVCVTFVYHIRGLFRKAGFIPILNNRFDEMSKMKTVVEDRKSSHRLGDYWWSWLGCTPRMRESVGDRPDVLGDGWICEESASGFVQTQNELVNGLCVWHWILFCVDWSLLNIHLFGGGEFILLLNALLWDVRAQRLYIDGHQSHGVNCQCGMRKWQLIKASVEKQSLVVDDQSTACVA